MLRQTIALSRNGVRNMMRSVFPSNMSSLTRATIAAAFGLGALVLALAFDLLGAGQELRLAAAGIAAACLGTTIVSLRGVRRVVSSIAKVCKGIIAGDFESRIVHGGDAGELRDLTWRINEVIDRTDAFVRESAAAMTEVAASRHHRKIVTIGMMGSYKSGAEKINAAIDAIATCVCDFR